MSNKMDSRQVVQRSAQAMIGSAADEQLNVLIPKVNDELAKLFEDRNLLLAGGGDVIDFTLQRSSSIGSFALDGNAQDCWIEFRRIG